MTDRFLPGVPGEEIGKFLAYLCTPDASYITGQSLNIDGGVVMW